MRIIFVILSFILLLSCNKNTQIKTIFVKDSTTNIIKISPKANWFSLKDSLLFFTENNFLYTFNLKQNSIEAMIKLKYNYPRIFIQNKDSIFILQLPFFNDNIHLDSLVYLIDNQGNIKKTYNLSSIPFFSQEAYQNKNFIYPYDITYRKDQIFIIFSPFPFNNTTTHHNLLYIIDANNKKISTIDTIRSPKVSSYNFYQGFTSPSIQTIDEKIIVSFEYSHTIYVIDADNKVQKKQAKSIALDTIILPKKFAPTNLYLDFLEQKFDNFYIRKVLYLSDNKQKNGYIILDDKFNTIGEFSLNNPLGFIKDNQLWTFKKDRDNLIAVVYDYDIATIDKSKLLKNINITLPDDNIEKCNVPMTDSQTVINIDKYLQQFINKDTFAAIIVPDYACTHCIDYALTEYSVNQNSFPQYNIFLVLPMANKNFFTKIKQLQIQQTPNVILDTNADYYNYNKGKINIHFVVIKNKKVTLNKVYNPEELNNWLIDLIKYLDSKDTLKSNTILQ